MLNGFLPNHVVVGLKIIIIIVDSLGDLDTATLLTCAFNPIYGITLDALGFLVCMF